MANDRSRQDPAQKLFPISSFEDFIHPFVVPPEKKISLAKDYDPAYTASHLDKSKGAGELQESLVALEKYQEILYAQNTYSLLIILQGRDAAGKDSTIKHVMTGMNPQGCQVYSFKTPSAEELDHDYLWRCSKALPERGRIGIFNRSYYEEVLVTRVHPELLQRQQLPEKLIDKHIWKRRFEEINNFEKYLVNNGIVVLKFFLNVSKDEQKKRFLARIDQPEKNWKFSANDAKEREFWHDYQSAYEDMLNHTSSKWAPWYVIPADHKWFTHLVVASIIHTQLKELNLKHPKVTNQQYQDLLQFKTILEKPES